MADSSRARLSYAIAVVAWLALCDGSPGGTPRGVVDRACPSDAIAVEPGTSIGEAVERHGEGTRFCLKAGIHRTETIRPRTRQEFFGEGGTILSGSRTLRQFERIGDQFAAATGPVDDWNPHGECETSAPACDLPQALFVDDTPLTPVPRREDVAPGRFFFDRGAGRVYFADQPAGHKVEFASTRAAFASDASNVVIANLVIERYATVPQHGAIDAERATGWRVEHCDIRFNSAAGIAVGRGAQVRDSLVHHNGQIGITGAGDDISIENNEVWANNSRHYDAGWEGGGVKLSLGRRITFHGNNVHHNLGPGLWCDGDCSETRYLDNHVEGNAGIGIFHEISGSALISRNIVVANGTSGGWFWGSNIVVAGSEGVKVSDNRLRVTGGKCGIVLIDQGRDDRPHHTTGPLYKTRNNTVVDNDTIFGGPACAGGVSDVPHGHESYFLIEDGNNRFDRNVYRVPRDAGKDVFVWGHHEYEWSIARQKGFEPDGALIRY